MQIVDCQHGELLAPATAQTIADDNAEIHFRQTLFAPVSDEEWGATHTQPSDGETQSTAALPEYD